MSKLERYLIESEIGQGGMATVYSAHDSETNTDVAIKELRLSPTLSEERRSEIIERFTREAKAVSELESDHIVKILDSFSEDDREFIVMELLEGQTLAAVLKAGALSPEAAISVTEQILEAMTVAQAKGIVHRDLKPENIFLLEDGTVKVTDFGIAHVSSTEAGLTRAGQVLGTVGYMPPEQIRGTTVDGRSDIFAVGVILYQMLSGANPFAAEQPTTMMYRISYEEPPALDPIVEGLPSFLSSVLIKAMAKDPDQRYQSAEEMLVDVRGGIEPDTTAILAAAAERTAEREKSAAAAAASAAKAASVPSVPRRGFKFDRNIMIAVGIAVLLVVGGGITAFAINQHKQSDMAKARDEIISEGREVSNLVKRAKLVRSGLDNVAAGLKAKGTANAASVARWDSQRSATRAAYAAKLAEVNAYNSAELLAQANSAVIQYATTYSYYTGYTTYPTGTTYMYKAKHKNPPKVPKDPAKIAVDTAPESATLDQLSTDLASLKSEVASSTSKARYFQVAFQRVGEAVTALEQALSAHRGALAGLVRRDAKKGAIVDQTRLGGLGTSATDASMQNSDKELALYLQNYGVNVTELTSVETTSSNTK